MGAIINLIRTAGDFFNSTEEEQFMSSRKGIIYKKNSVKDWNPYEEELQLQKTSYSYSDGEETEDTDDVSNEMERFIVAKGRNFKRKSRTQILDMADVYQAPKERQAHVSYMIDDDGSVIKM
ncbi:MAG: hypothetical protein M3Q44_08075 [bacterium]|nr:hypothetical protein [bacterium]